MIQGRIKKLKMTKFKYNRKSELWTRKKSEKP